MFKNKSGLKSKIADLVNQLEENNQIIYLQKLAITDLQEEILTLVGKYQNGIEAQQQENEIEQYQIKTETQGI